MIRVDLIVAVCRLSGCGATLGHNSRLCFNFRSSHDPYLGKGTCVWNGRSPPFFRTFMFNGLPYMPSQGVQEHVRQPTNLGFLANMSNIVDL
jgi:hypothetical protein